MVDNSIHLLFKHRKMLIRVTLKELKATYAGTLLGLGWLLLVPLLMLAVYAIVYLFIFRVRPASMEPVTYVLYIFSGLVPFLMTAEVLSRSVSSISTNENMLTNTVFPVDLIPVRDILIAQGMMIIGMILILVLAVIVAGIQWTYLFLPILWIVHLMFLTGLAWVLSLVSILLRDMEQFMRIITIVLMVSLPIAYTPDMIPSGLRLFFYLNPFSYYIIAYQKLIVLGTLPSLFETSVMMLMSLGTLWFAGRFFAHTKNVMVDYV